MMDPEVENEMVEAAVVERCFMCAKILEIGSFYSNCTKMHLDNYEKYVQKHEVYKHIFSVRFMEYYPNEAQVFTTCSGCFEGVDELLFINNQMEELENQLGVLVESLTAEILQNRNRYSETLTDPLEIDPLDTTKIELQSTTISKPPILADVAEPEPKVEVEDFECPPSPISPQATWEMDPDIETETEQIFTLSPSASSPDNNVVVPNENSVDVADSNTGDIEDIYSIMSSRVIRIVLKKLDVETITSYTKSTGTSSMLQIKNENVETCGEINAEVHNDSDGDWNVSVQEDDSDSDFETTTEDKPKRKRRAQGTQPKKTLIRWKKNSAIEYFSCEICGDKMKPMSRTKFKKHILKHPKYQPYKCTFPNCDVKFRWYYALKIHEKKHESNEEGYNCDVCGKSYGGPYELRKHKQRVHVEESEECKICEKKFKLKQGLMVHVKRHHGLSHLEYDEKHSQATPFCCEICQKCYSSENMLQTHNQRIHSENIDFFCDFCNINVTPVRSLIYISYATRNLHTIGKVIKCTRKICREGFNCSEKYNKHKEDHRLQGVNRRTKKFTTTDESRASKPKFFGPRRKYKPRKTGPRIPRKLLSSEGQELESEEMTLVKSENEKLQTEKKPRKERKKKLQNKENATDAEKTKQVRSGKQKLQIKKESKEEDSLKNTADESLLNGEEENNPEDDNLISDHEIPDDDYLLSDGENNDDTDWLSDEEKSKKKKNTKQKRKYKKRLKSGETAPVKTKQKRVHKLIFKCDKCDENFKRETTLIKHNMKVHQQENSLLSFANSLKTKLACEVCGKGFRKEESLARHEKLHNKAKKKLICELCGKGFRKQESLTRHEQMHNKVKRRRKAKREIPEEELKSLLCDLCGKVFKNRGLLNRHKNTHNPPTEEEKSETYHKCDLCGQLLKFKSSYVKHMQNHFDVQLSVEEKLKISGISCEKCGKPMTTASNLRRHLRQAHNDEKPFECPHPGCNRKYKDAENLSKHVESHQAVAKYQCDICQKKFFRRDYLLLHFRRNHSTTSKQYQTWKSKVDKQSMSDGAPITKRAKANSGVPISEEVRITEMVSISEGF